MELVQVSKQQGSEYIKALRYLIGSTINLPKEAIEHFSAQWTEEKVKNNLNDWLFLMAKEKDNVSGVVLGTPIEGGVGTIIWVLVDKNIQKKGVGTDLFQEACKIYKSKGAHKLKLTVPDELTVDFYKKQGMDLEGIHKNHWWNTDFWSMGKQL